MDDTVLHMEDELGHPFFDYQLQTFAGIEKQSSPLRACLYYRMGAGKTITATAALKLVGATEALVLAPPVAQEQWVNLGKRLGITIEAISHAKFRQKGYLVKRGTAIVVDEFHLLGGHTGMGWKKLDRLAKGLQAPLLILSATPSYNDAERVYCVQHVMDPDSCKGGFLQFLYTHCHTEQNPFSQTPKVTGFKNHANAEEFLKSLPYVYHVPDIHKKDPSDLALSTKLPDEMFDYGVHRRKERIMASQMEARHSVEHDVRVDEDGFIYDHIMSELEVMVGNCVTPTLMFCASARIAEALAKTCERGGARVGIVTGKMTKTTKEARIELFKKGRYDVLIGTATLATGTDGLDKMCDQLIIVHDTDDDSLRRQLIGRILPRGADGDASRKLVSRLIVHP